MEYNISSSLHIRTKAVELLNENNIDTFCEINIKSLISLLNYNITHQFADLKGLAGFTCYELDGERYRIFIDSVTFENCPPRTSFTMAHELGHIVLGHFEKAHTNSIFFGDRFLEIESNLFADELLMPTSQIIRRRMDAREIVETYNVSITAAQNKIKYLKTNSLYPQEKALIHVFNILSKHPILPTYNAYNDYKVEKLRDAWLDPDYEF